MTESSSSDTEKHPLNPEKGCPKKEYKSYGTGGVPSAVTITTGLGNNGGSHTRERARSNESTRSDSSSSSSVAPRKVYLKDLFRFATKQDKWVIAFGTLFSVIHGAGMPILARVFGLMTDIIIQQSIYGFANETNGDNHTTTTVRTSYLPHPESISVTTLSSLLVNGVTSQNTTTGNPRPPVPEGLLTRKEFAAFMAELSMDYIYIGIGVFFASFIQAVFFEWSCERQAYRLRQEFLYQVLRQESSWYDHHQTGDLAMKLADDLERIREGTGHKLSMIIQFFSTFIAGFVIGFLVSWQLTLLILALTPLLTGSGAYTGRLLATQSVREQQKYGKAGAVAEEVLSSMKTVASFGGEQRAIERYESQLMDGLHLAVKKYRSLALGIGLVFVILFASYALAFWFGVQLLHHDLISPGSIFTVFLSVLMGAFSVGNAVPYISTLGVARGSAAVVFDIIDSIPRIDPYSKAGLTPATIKGRIQFRNVDFTYPSRKKVSILQNFTVDIEPGKTVAFVGHSGVGKSTLVSLILRFYDPDSGAVLLDGHDLKSLNLAWIRHHIGVVSQEPILFGTTIYENIAYGRDCVTPDEVVTAARMANAHDFISILPQGYETLVGERGAQLSGGQKQRVAIARALVRDPKILLLDEATSALDARSESIVQGALEKARKGRTTIIIAHRLSTIKDADVIYVMKDGRIAEFGTHSELMAREELYYDLVAAQMSLNTLQEIEADPTADMLYCDSTEESIGDFDIEAEKRRRRKTRRIRKRRMRALPDPDRARMAEEAEELNVKYPGFMKTLALNRPEACQLIAGFIGCLISGCVMPTFAMMYSSMFVTVTKQGEELLSLARFWSLMILGLALISGFGHWMRTLYISEAGEYLTMRLRLLSFVGVVRQSVGWFDKETNSPGRVSTRLARDAPMVKAAAGHRLAAMITCFVTVCVGLAMAFVFGWQLALVLLAVLPLIVAGHYISTHVQKSGFQTDAMIMEESGNIANESIQNIRTVQALAQEKLFFSKYVESLIPVYMEAHKQGIIYGLAFAFSEAILFFIYGGAFRYSAYLIEEDLMTSINVYRVFFAQAFSAIAIGQALSFLPDYSKANLAAGLIFNLIELKSQIDPFSPDGLRPKIEGRITLSDVRFCYPERDQYAVLHGLSFDLQAGKSLALIGPSGCGKSTIVSLIERFYDVSDGQVLIDGYDVRSLNISHLRKNIGLVTQEPVLFDCTIRENIAYGYTSDDGGSCPDDLIIKAAREANIHHFIVSLPRGYETVVGERGRQLSGGQKQRIAIARALVRDPKILLLDEATSALDSENEKIVQEALDKARAGRTCIMIAHRLSTIQNADYIAVITRGKIMEQGTNEQLRARKGLFYKLTKNQTITH